EHRFDGRYSDGGELVVGRLRHLVGALLRLEFGPIGLDLLRGRDETADGDRCADAGHLLALRLLVAPAPALFLVAIFLGVGDLPFCVGRPFFACSFAAVTDSAARLNSASVSMRVGRSAALLSCAPLASGFVGAGAEPLRLM